MNVSFEKSDALNATLTIDIAREDYEPDYTKALKTYQKNGSFKGFRKGKTPLGYIKKIYGEAALADTVNKVLQQAIGEYLREHEIDFLGQPLPAEGHDPVRFDPKNLENYKFKFDLGIAPSFEVQGLDASVQRFDVQIPSEMIDEEIANYQKRLGTTVETEETIIPGDLIYITGQPLGDGETKEDGLKPSFPLSVDDIADAELKERVMQMKAGDTFDYDPFNLEAGRDEAFVRKYHFGIENDDEETDISGSYRASIDRVSRVVPAEVNQEFIDRLFGPGKVDNIEDAREEIRKGLKADYDRRADGVLYKEMQKSLMDANPMELPKEFLERWLGLQRDEGQPEPTEQDMSDFLLDLRWQLIKDKIANANGLEVAQEEIQQGAYQRVYQYIGPYGDQETVQRLAQSILGNEEQVQRIAREVMASKVFDVLRESFDVSDKEVSVEEFDSESERILQPTIES